MPNINAIISTLSKIHGSANKIIISELKSHNLEGLVPSHGDILILLYEKEDGIPMSQISQKIGKDKSTVTALINKLEGLGLLEKLKNEKDSRSTLIKLTKKGLLTKPIVIDRISKKLLDRAYTNFTEEEKKVLCTLLEKMNENF